MEAGVYRDIYGLGLIGLKLWDVRFRNHAIKWNRKLHMTWRLGVLQGKYGYRPPNTIVLNY